jgi:hypothetical protein
MPFQFCRWCGTFLCPQEGINKHSFGCWCGMLSHLFTKSCPNPFTRIWCLQIWNTLVDPIRVISENNTCNMGTFSNTTGQCIVILCIPHPPPETAASGSSWGSSTMWQKQRLLLSGQCLWPPVRALVMDPDSSNVQYQSIINYYLDF